jgi:membrane protein YdbS with pleckstrin-like domain
MIAFQTSEVWPVVLVLMIFLVMYSPIIYLLYEIYKGEYKNSNKWVWFFVVLILSYFGAVVYLLIGRPQRLSK